MHYNGPIADSHVHAFAPKEDMYRVFDEMISFGAKEAALLAYTYEETGIDNNIICLHYKKTAKKCVFGRSAVCITIKTFKCLSRSRPSFFLRWAQTA